MAHQPQSGCSGVLKVIKNKSYYKRYKVKLRRRRKCKTDYQARRTLIVQDKNKYNSPKYRFAVRITNKDIIAQVIAAKVIGDEVLAAAYAHELPQYGVKAGLTNYAACYCTGLLAARRALKKVGLDKAYEGCTEPDGTLFENEVNDDMEEDEIKRPLRAFLDVGLARTTTGSRIFGVLKGAVDGGLDIPHREKRFPGYFAKEAGDDDGEDTFDAEFHRKYIFGGHVADYMKKMQEESEDKYKAHFAKYIAAGIGADNMEEMYTNAHKAIRANPDSKKKVVDYKNMKTFPQRKKMHRNQRKARVQQKIRQALAKAAADA